MRRRDFLKETSATFAAAALGSCGGEADWRRLRLVHAADARELERTALADAASLLERAIGRPVPLVDEREPSGDLDIVVTATEGSASKPGGFRISRDGSRLLVSGFGAEGARNGLYRLLEHLGFAFFRDGETIPALAGPALLDLETMEEPSFALRGDMIWDNYLGPRRYCAAMWGEDEWERAFLYLARNRMNFLEFYPPLSHSMALAFPEARGLSEGAVWKADVKHELAKKVLARGRALGIRFMYVLSYGAFPEPVQALFPHLEWRNGFLCAHQPELPQLTETLWRRLIEDLGTDRWYAIRHRGEEEQPYGDPCRSVTKKEGYLQAFAVLSKIDPEASATVWTWGEKADLFAGFPSNVRAVHVRHGMANVFGDRGEGREQTDGAPPLEGGRRWLSAHFTVFGGNETLLQTGWSDARALARDAATASADGSCEGFFQWPEWSDTSPWLSHAVARIAWNPDELRELEPALSAYARARHGDRAERYLGGFLPLLRDGNARFMHPPRKRLLVPYFLAPESLKLLADVRAGVLAMGEALEGASSLYHRDFVDLASWSGLRQAQVFEAAAYLAHVDGKREVAADACRHGEAAWRGLRDVLSQSPELSLVSSARGLSRVGELSTGVVDSLWTLGCDFYNGYPLVLSPEAIELVYLPQLAALRLCIEGADQSGLVCFLDEPGWFWHDFSDRRWADSVRRLPSEDASRFEEEMRSRLRTALGGAAPAAPRPAMDWLAAPLPSPVSEPPGLPS